MENLKIEIRKRHYIDNNGDEKYGYQVALLTTGQTILLKQVFDKDYGKICRLAENNPDMVVDIPVREN